MSNNWGEADLLLLLCFFVSFFVDSWLVPQRIGYVLTFGAIVGSMLYLLAQKGVVLPSRRESAFLLLYSVFWIGIITHYVLHNESLALLYVVIVPIVVYSLMFVFPRHVTLSNVVTGTAYLGVLVTVIGAFLLIIYHIFGIRANEWIGATVFSVSGLRTTSVFANPNTMGIVMFVAAVSGLYDVLADFSGRTLLVLLISIFGLVISDGHTSIAGFAIASVLLVSYRSNRHAAIVFVSYVTVGVIVSGTLPVQQELHQSMTWRLYLWRATVLQILEEPLIGIGFASTGPEIAPYIPAGILENVNNYESHNAYLHALLHVGVAFGAGYLSAIGYAVYTTVANCVRRNSLNQYVVAMVIAIVFTLIFETATLGGLSPHSLFLAFFLGTGMDGID